MNVQLPVPPGRAVARWALSPATTPTGGLGFADGFFDSRAEVEEFVFPKVIDWT